MSKIAIFGAGIAGLTVAHEMLKQGHYVTIYEKLPVVGGMARSRREEGSNMPTEHSWRGFAPFYENFDQLSKEIPVGQGKTVYNELNTLVDFIKVKNKIDTPSEVTLSDKLVALTKFSQIIFSGNNRTASVYAKENVRDYFYPRLSPAGRDMLTTLGPWLGLDEYNSSFLDVTNYVIMSFLIKKSHYHTDEGKTWEHKRGTKWHLMKKPTSEAWFDPWIKYLKSKGMKLNLGVSLMNLNMKDGKVDSCSTSAGRVSADKYVVAINPFEFADIISQNAVLRSNTQMHDCQQLVKNGPNVMISFRIAYSEEIKMPDDKIAFILPDSEFNLTLYPQEYTFDREVYLGKNVKSLWSGTACICYIPGTLFNLPAERCSKEQFIKEVHYQLGRSTQLQEIVAKSNSGRKMTEFPVFKTEVWYEWEFGKSGEMIKNQSKKWVTMPNTHQYRPSQKTDFNNLFLAGSHTNTSVVIWSMEGAVESGKRAVKAMGEPVELYTHQKPSWLKPFGVTDNILYSIGFPNIIITTLLVIILIIVILVIAILRKKLRPCLILKNT